MKKFIGYILMATFFSGLISFSLSCLIHTWWISYSLSVICGILMGGMCARSAIINEKLKRLSIKIDTNNYLAKIDERGQDALLFEINRTLKRLTTKMDYLDEQLANLTQPKSTAQIISLDKNV